MLGLELGCFRHRVSLSPKMRIIMFLFIFWFCRNQGTLASSLPSSPSPASSDLEVTPAKSPCRWWCRCFDSCSRVVATWVAVIIFMEYDGDLDMWYVVFCVVIVLAQVAYVCRVHLTVAYVLPECWFIFVPANFRRSTCPILVKVMLDFSLILSMTCARIYRKYRVPRIC